MLKDTIKAGIKLYTGMHIDEVKVHADRKVPGAYGIRVTARRITKKGVHKTPQTLDFILLAHWRNNASQLTPELVEEWLEDAQFSSWPPVEGNLRFF